MSRSLSCALGSRAAVALVSRRGQKCLTRLSPNAEGAFLAGHSHPLEKIWQNGRMRPAKRLQGRMLPRFAGGNHPPHERSIPPRAATRRLRRPHREWVLGVGRYETMQN